MRTLPAIGNPRQQGFTLVEVLAALAVVAVALAAGSQAADVLLRLAERQTQQWLAQQCADQARIAVRLEPTFPDPGKRTLPCEQGGMSFAVVLDIGTTPNPSFRRVQARVALAAQPQQPLLRTTTIVGRH